MFSRRVSREVSKNSASVEGDILMEKNTAYGSNRSSLTDTSILMERNTAYNGMRFNSFGFEEKDVAAYEKLQSNLCDALDLYESVNLGDLGMLERDDGACTMDEGDSFNSTPLGSLDPSVLSIGIARTESKRVPGLKLNRSWSCESLALYETIDFVDVSGPCLPDLHERKKKYMAKSTSLSNTPLDRVKLQINSTPVGQLVRQFESLSPVVDTHKADRPLSSICTFATPSSSCSSPLSSNCSSLGRNFSSPVVTETLKTSLSQSLGVDACSSADVRISDSFETMKISQSQSGTSSPADEREVGKIGDSFETSWSQSLGVDASSSADVKISVSFETMKISRSQSSPANEKEVGKIGGSFETSWSQSL